MGITPDILDFARQDLLYKDQEVRRALQETIFQYKPAIVFIQPPQDCLLSHVLTARYCYEAAIGVVEGMTEQNIALPFEVYAMECPTWPYPRVDIYIDISAEMETVGDALLSYTARDTEYGEGLARMKQSICAISGEQADRIPYAEGFLSILCCTDMDSLPFIQNDISDAASCHPERSRGISNVTENTGDSSTGSE